MSIISDISAENTKIYSVISKLKNISNIDIRKCLFEWSFLWMNDHKKYLHVTTIYMHTIILFCTDFISCYGKQNLNSKYFVLN